MEILGLEFEFIDGDNILEKICEIAELNNYWLHIENDDIHYNKNNHYNILELPKIISGSDFILKLKAFEFYLISIEIKAFSNKDKIVEIKSYKDFINSNCDFILLNYDCNNFRVFCKNSLKLNRIYNYLLNNNIVNLRYLKKDDNLKMSIF